MISFQHKQMNRKFYNLVQHTKFSQRHLSGVSQSIPSPLLRCLATLVACYRTSGVIDAVSKPKTTFRQLRGSFSFSCAWFACLQLAIANIRDAHRLRCSALPQP
ncbi:hypothetical protein ISCGN_017402 [Ixodes scapularis]